ncbi:NUDIX hydrolase [Phaeobacter sp. B1627]|uniref:NUDIX hydrolase n=1 Tax=Phaeobacter sp. B1627 TaxID=2583809 RepID=UPI001118A0A1|nr:NUDIX hydrolase [Phaeobacter sp. B1627]TNJ41071.1 NUDIX domain-containing protein [Phaeobacter sp. B1627]
MHFIGAKLALFLGHHLLVILRDERTDIPFPGYWDFPGGGREGDEDPEDCVLRETEEEVGLRLLRPQLTHARCYPNEEGHSWFFAAHLDMSSVDDIRFGNEGQGWELMAPQDYLSHPLGIPNFKSRLQDYLSKMGAPQR